jgi:hypothetical protein
VNIVTIARRFQRMVNDCSAKENLALQLYKVVSTKKATTQGDRIFRHIYYIRAVGVNLSFGC